MPKGSPSLTTKVCGGSSLKLFSSDFRTKTEFVMAVPYLFLAKHWYWPTKGKDQKDFRISCTLNQHRNIMTQWPGTCNKVHSIISPFTNELSVQWSKSKKESFQNYKFSGLNLFMPFRFYVKSNLLKCKVFRNCYFDDFGVSEF